MHFRFSRFTRMAAIFMLFIVFSVPAHAGIIQTAKNWFSGEALTLFISAVAALASGMTGLLYSKAVKTFRETGDFLSVLGSALEDNRLTRDELAQIVREGRDIFSIWR
jgi:hypothetical protein